MKDVIRSTIKEVTLELVYEVVDERTQNIKERLGRLEGDMRDLHHEMAELRGDMNRRFETLNGDINRRFEALNGRIDQLFTLITNQRKS